MAHRKFEPVKYNTICNPKRSDKMRTIFQHFDKVNNDNKMSSRVQIQCGKCGRKIEKKHLKDHSLRMHKSLPGFEKTPTRCLELQVLL